MAFIPLADGARVAFQYTQVDGSDAINRVYFVGADPFDAASLEALAESCAARWGDHVAAKTSQTVTLVSVAARAMDTDTSPSTVFNPTTGNVGTAPVGPTVLGTTFAITLRTGLAGISHRGRWFWVGVPSNYLSGTVFNGLIGADAIAMAGALMDMFTAINGDAINSANAVVASFFEPPTVDGHSTPRAAGVSEVITTTGYHDLFIDFQRRRAPGHNIHR